jgi:hypothetical protein
MNDKLCFSHDCDLGDGDVAVGDLLLHLLLEEEEAARQESQL